MRNLTGEIPTASAIRDELAKIVKSSWFSHSARMRRFLSYVVEETLAARGSALKEYTIALNVYDKPAQFDPRTDSIIRVEANRLRSKLENYYGVEGRTDPVVIQLPKNSYVPRFCLPGGCTVAAAPKSDWELEYLKGKHFLNKRDPDSLQEAIRCFTSAATKPSAFPMAMAGLADCYTTSAWLEFSAPEPVWSQATLYARRALGETPPFRQALTTLACENALHRWDWLAAERQFQEVLKFDAAYIPAYQGYALFCLAPQGRFDEGLCYLQRARQLDPNNAVTSCYLGRLFYLDRRYSEALRELNYSIRLNPKLLPAYWHLGFTYSQLERWEDAVAALSAVLDILNEPVGVAALGYVNGLSGRREAALQSRALLTGFTRTHYVSPMSFALVEIGLANHDAAFEHLYSALDSRAARLVHLPVDPAFDGIKTDARFMRILRRLGL